MRLLLIFLSSFLLLNAAEMGLKGGSCTLTQEGQVSINYHSKVYKNVNYVAHAKSGKNFRELFIGSTIKVVKVIQLKIIDYKPNKRVKGKPKTGIFFVEATLNNKKESIVMAYIFDKGIMSAIGVAHNTPISFSTKVSYSLCHLPKKQI